MELNRVVIYRQSESSSNNCSIIFVWVYFSTFFFLQIWFDMCWLIKHSLKIIFQQWILLKWVLWCFVNHVEDSTHRKLWLPALVYSTYTHSKDAKVWVIWRYRSEFGCLHLKVERKMFASPSLHTLFESREQCSRRHGAVGSPGTGMHSSQQAGVSQSGASCIGTAVRGSLHSDCQCWLE